MASDDYCSLSYLQALLNLLPEFKPGDNLSIFISEVDMLIAHVGNRLTKDHLFLLNATIRSKIKGKARDLITYLPSHDWPTIRQHLISIYTDYRSVDLSILDLCQTIQMKNDTLEDFHQKIEEKVNVAMGKAWFKYIDPIHFGYKKVEIEKKAVETFKLGLLEPLRSHVLKYNLCTLAEYVNICKTYEFKEKLSRKNHQSDYNYQTQQHQRYPSQNYSKLNKSYRQF